MRAFIIAKNTPAYVVKQYGNWNTEMRRIHTKEEHMFFVEEMRIDPTGIAKHCSVPADAKTIGGQFARDGFYGFLRDGWYLIVHAANVEVK